MAYSKETYLMAYRNELALIYGLADIDPFQDAVPCWLHPQPVPLRDFHAEMFAVICGAISGHGPHSVKLVVNGHKFRCVPSVKGGVIVVPS